VALHERARLLKVLSAIERYTQHHGMLFVVRGMKRCHFIDLAITDTAVMRPGDHNYPFGVANEFIDVAFAPIQVMQDNAGCTRPGNHRHEHAEH
jgi:hypothetical protein